MNCMKCGREIQDGVFCSGCLEEMEYYPIKPGTVVQLPLRKEKHQIKKVHARRKSQPAPEEQVKRLRRLVLRLILSLLISWILLGVAGYFAVVHLMESDNRFLPGQNYSAISTDPLDEWD